MVLDSVLMCFFGLIALFIAGFLAGGNHQRHIIHRYLWVVRPVRCSWCKNVHFPYCPESSQYYILVSETDPLTVYPDPGEAVQE